jgi:ubiquinone/menaquinone biosynthesis C-methylase UbiE
MTFPDHFSAQAEQYAQARPRYPAELIAFVAEAAPGRACAWDCATGSGQAALALAEHFALVYATDASAAQIAQATPHPRVSYAVQPAEQSKLAPASVDALTVAQALHWFDHPAFFAEARRVLKPGGLFCAWGYSWATVTPAIDAVIERSMLAIIADEWAPQNRLLWNGYRGIALPFTPMPTPEVTIQVHWNMRQYLAYVQTWSATQRTITRLGQGFLTAAAVELAQVWGPIEHVRTVQMPVCVVAGHAS